MDAKFQEQPPVLADPQMPTLESGAGKKLWTPGIDPITGDLNIGGHRMVSKSQLEELGVTPQTAVELFGKALPGLMQLAKPDSADLQKSEPQPRVEPPVYNNTEEVPQDTSKIPVGAVLYKNGSRSQWTGTQWTLPRLG